MMLWTEKDRSGLKYLNGAHQRANDPFFLSSQVMSGLYSSKSVVIWNGNMKSGSSNIMEFYLSLPGSNHRLTTFDCQPVLSSSATTSVMVCCRGSVKFDGQPSEKLFSQNFLLSKEGEVWKVVSDCFRFSNHHPL